MSKVLVVDDSAVDRRLVGGLLERESGLLVAFARDGRDAMEHIKKEPPNLVLTDLMMPEMDGLELVAAVTTNFPLVPVILMTGRGSEEIAVRALQAGAASYVPKDSLQELLLDTVRQVLALAREEARMVELMNSLRHCEFCFELSNEPAMIPPLIDYLHRSVRAVGVCDEVNAIRVCVALEEALNNAMIHGNLELPSTTRDADPETFRQLISERQVSLPYQQRRVRVQVHVSGESAQFVIRDEGPGFDPRRLPDPTAPENLERTSGRGILLMQTFMDQVAFNELGNEVTLIKRRCNELAR